MHIYAFKESFGQKGFQAKDRPMKKLFEPEPMVKSVKLGRRDSKT